MNCPDCRGQVKMDYIDSWIGGVFDDTSKIEPYYKCPKCKAEFEPEDLEEE